MNPNRYVGLWSGLVLITNPAATHAPAHTAAGWPVIQPIHAEYSYVRPDKPGEDVPFLAYLLDTQGGKLYRFECHAGGYHDDSYDMDFSGDLQCVLFPYKIDTVSAVNVLAAETRAEQRNDRHNRGRILAAQLQGRCLDFPEYSTLRHFQLRGMDVTMTIRDMAWEGTGKSRVLTRFTVVLDAVPDDEAKSPYAEPAPEPAPSKACYP